MLTELLAAHGGWLHRRDLLERGWSSSGILRRRRDEGILLMRRRWLVLPDAPPEIRAAAALGGHVTCASALARYGLWVPPEIAAHVIPHIAIDPSAHEDTTSVVAHRARALARRSPRDLVDPIENVLAHAAVCFAEPQAFAIWESALNRDLVTSHHLRSLPWTSIAARRLSALASDLSDSGVESTFVWQARNAGFRVVQQAMIDGHPVDGLIGRRLVVQLDGFAFHSDPARRRRDLAQDRRLLARGYTVLRFDYRDIMHDWPLVERDIRAALARIEAA
ncbi:endonuclease domain-containing protein [Microbacterium indicum]|uniref:endonuclease domain-containing protein n=1 Tax=Microbacterium indicum TaxID=358100 RepID=UPI00048AB269|nr:DUF559 domain-containing protein [Microbacterium indicum]